jgi:TonB family protein
MSQLHNPFAAPKPKKEALESWGIAPSGPPVDAREVETEARAAEVTILWGDDVLHVAHVSPPRTVAIGEVPGADYAIAKEILGVDRLPIVIERGGQLHCVVPDGASGVVTAGGASKSIAQLEADAQLVPYAELSGARLYAMPEGATARVEHRGLSFLVRPTNAGKRIGGKTEVRFRHAGWVGLSLAVHGIMLLLFYFMPPRTSALSIDDITARDRMVEYLDAAAATVEMPEPEWTATEEAAEQGGTGTRHDGEEGQSGDPSERPTRNRFGVQGDPNDRNPELARENLRENLQNVGALGTLRVAMGSWNTPTSPYGADQAHGNDAMAAIGALMGDQTGQNYGLGGLGMHGTGRGAGGHGLGTIGLGTLGTIGHGGGNGGGNGYGGGVGLPGPDRESRVPRVLTPAVTDVMGSLSPEVIRRVVRQHLPEVRFCYEQGLQSDASMEGRVTVSWVIGGNGQVTASRVGSSDLGNERVEGCIVQAVRRWTFPAPQDHGMVGVNYPFVLDTH